MAATAPKSPGVRTPSIDYLRSFITLLVLFVHAILAYSTSSRFNPENFSHSVAPIVDPIKWAGFDLAPRLLNTFIMPLMFFISGLFVWKSLTRKGPRYFLRDRLLRLGAPFVISLVVIMPLAYYPSFLQSGQRLDFFTYWRSWEWISGPAWFVSMLLVFNLLAALCFWVSPGSVWARRVPQAVFTNPMVFFLVLVGAALIAFLPLLYLYGPFTWFYWGPCLIGQSSRLLLYLVYFFAGVAVGAYGLDGSFLGPALSRRWLPWSVAAVLQIPLFSLALAGVQGNISSALVPASQGWLLFGFSLVLCSAIFSLACMSLFLRFVNRRVRILDFFSDNAYGIYLVHFPLVIWTQFLLVDSTLPAPAKASIVLIFSLLFSWFISAFLRSFSVVRNII